MRNLIPFFKKKNTATKISLNISAYTLRQHKANFLMIILRIAIVSGTRFNIARKNPYRPARLTHDHSFSAKWAAKMTPRARKEFTCDRSILHSLIKLPNYIPNGSNEPIYAKIYTRTIRIHQYSVRVPLRARNFFEKQVVSYVENIPCVIHPKRVARTPLFQTGWLLKPCETDLN